MPVMDCNITFAFVRLTRILLLQKMKGLVHTYIQHDPVTCKVCFYIYVCAIQCDPCFAIYACVYIGFLLQLRPLHAQSSGILFPCFHHRSFSFSVLHPSSFSLVFHFKTHCGHLSSVILLTYLNHTSYLLQISAIMYLPIFIPAMSQWSCTSGSYTLNITHPQPPLHGTKQRVCTISFYNPRSCTSSSHFVNIWWR